MTRSKEQVSAQIESELLATMRQVARADGMSFEAALEDAMREHIAAWECRHPGVRPEIMAHYRDSVERNRRLYELLAEAERERRPPSRQ